MGYETEALTGHNSCCPDSAALVRERYMDVNV